MMYRKLFAATKKQEELYNARDPLYEALIKGDVAYSYGRFFGSFNSTLTKQLRAIGAVYDPRKKNWKMPASDLPVDVRSALAVRGQRDYKLGCKNYGGKERWLS